MWQPCMYFFLLFMISISRRQSSILGTMLPLSNALKEHLKHELLSVQLLGVHIYDLQLVLGD